MSVAVVNVLKILYSIPSLHLFKKEKPWLKKCHGPEHFLDI